MELEKAGSRNFSIVKIMQTDSIAYFNKSEGNAFTETWNKIAFNLGIREKLADFELQLIFDFVSKYFKTLTLQDMSDAFGLYSAQKLNFKNSHYQSMDNSFIGSVLTAYREYTAQQNKNKAPETLQIDFNPMPIDKNKQAIKAFNEFKKKGSYFDFSNIIYKHLDETGVLNVSTKRKKAFWEKAKQNIIHDLKTGSNHMEKISMKVMIKAVEVGSRNQKIKADAMRLALTDYFQGLVDMEMDIEINL